jgi:hypothetical protein
MLERDNSSSRSGALGHGRQWNHLISLASDLYGGAKNAHQYALSPAHINPWLTMT